MSTFEIMHPDKQTAIREAGIKAGLTGELLALYQEFMARAFGCSPEFFFASSGWAESFIDGDTHECCKTSTREILFQTADEMNVEIPR